MRGSRQLQLQLPARAACAVVREPLRDVSPSPSPAPASARSRTTTPAVVCTRPRGFSLSLNIPGDSATPRGDSVVAAASNHGIYPAERASRTTLDDIETDEEDNMMFPTQETPRQPELVPKSTAGLPIGAWHTSKEARYVVKRRAGSLCWTGPSTLTAWGGSVQLETYPAGHSAEGELVVLGRGGSACVVRGTREDGSQVAVKLAKGLDAVRCLVWEAETLCALHASVPTTSCAFTPDALVRPVSFVAGSSSPPPARTCYGVSHGLREAALILELGNGDLATAHGLSEEMVATIGLQLAGTLAAMHAQDVAHGDVKPQNVLVSMAATEHNYAVTLIDCGGAVHTEPPERAHMSRVEEQEDDTTDCDMLETIPVQFPRLCAGDCASVTPDYAAPEVIEASEDHMCHPYDPFAGDMYSLGKTLTALASPGIVKGTSRLACLLRAMVAESPLTRPSAQEAATVLDAIVHPSHVAELRVLADVAAASPRLPFKPEAATDVDHADLLLHFGSVSVVLDTDMDMHPP